MQWVRASLGVIAYRVSPVCGPDLGLHEIILQLCFVMISIYQIWVDFYD